MINSTPRGDTRTGATHQLHESIQRQSGHTDWLPGEVTPVEQIGDRWIFRYGTNNEYSQEYPSEPAWSVTNRAIKSLLGESGVAWQTYRAIVALRGSSDTDENSRQVQAIVASISEKTVGQALLSVFEQRLGNERQACENDGPTTSALCNMVPLYAAAVGALKKLEES